MKVFKILLFIIGIALLIINITGLFKSMRNPDVYNEQNTGRLNDISLTLNEAKKEIIRKPGESDKAFTIRLNDVIAKSMLHYWKNEGVKKYYLGIPIWENYILYFTNFFRKDKRYEFVYFHKKNLERGAGICSTHAIVMQGILQKNGVEAQLWCIAGHVLVRAKVANNEWYIMDPDFGLYVPYDVDDIEANPEITRAIYQNMADLYKPDYDDPYTTDKVVEIYGRDGNRIYTYSAAFEIFSYIMIWLLPLLFMMPYGFQLLKRI